MTFSLVFPQTHKICLLVTSRLDEYGFLGIGEVDGKVEMIND